MHSTSSIAASNFGAEMAKTFLEGLAQGTLFAYQAIWSGILNILSKHCGIVIAFLCFALVSSFIRLVITGRWGLFASVVYNCLYFGSLFLVTLLFGVEIFTNTFIDLFLFILYAICFWVTGKVIRKLTR